MEITSTLCVLGEGFLRTACIRRFLQRPHGRCGSLGVPERRQQLLSYYGLLDQTCMLHHPKQRGASDGMMNVIFQRSMSCTRRWRYTAPHCWIVSSVCRFEFLLLLLLCVARRKRPCAFSDTTPTADPLQSLWPCLVPCWLHC